MNPSLEASWRHPWRQDLHTGATMWLRRSSRGVPKMPPHADHYCAFTKARSMASANCSRE
ncbi:hypothetical protein [Halorhodospira halochloris]|uniref:hypothetical protein n=1 Tax=Halorhodospira halochloris TaxID=1052 RepID=UPI0013A5423C|nr:hypothetical protein [Halorhodospira halochloris]